jgi:hypothetical protein
MILYKADLGLMQFSFVFGLKPAFIYLFWSYGAVMITLWLPVAPFDLCLISTYFYQYIGINFYYKILQTVGCQPGYQ